MLILRDKQENETVRDLFHLNLNLKNKENTKTQDHSGNPRDPHLIYKDA